MGSRWGAAYVFLKYPICEQLSTGKTLRNPNESRKTHREKLNHQDVVVFLQCIGPGALLVSVVLPGGRERGVRREGGLLVCVFLQETLMPQVSGQSSNKSCSWFCFK